MHLILRSLVPFEQDRALFEVRHWATPSNHPFAGDPQKMVATGSDGVAIKGYDTVAYFTENQAMKGSPEFVHSWRDAEWYFCEC